MCSCWCVMCLGGVFGFFFFFFNDTATTEIYTLSLHDALPIFELAEQPARQPGDRRPGVGRGVEGGRPRRSEEHTSELQSHVNLVCRLLLEKKNNTKIVISILKNKKINQTI